MIAAVRSGGTLSGVIVVPGARRLVEAGRAFTLGEATAGSGAVTARAPFSALRVSGALSTRRTVAKSARGRRPRATIFAGRAFSALAVCPLDWTRERTLAALGRTAFAEGRAFAARTRRPTAGAFVARGPLEAATLVRTAAACAEARTLGSATFTQFFAFTPSRALFAARTGIEGASSARCAGAARIVGAAGAAWCAKGRAARAFVTGKAGRALAFSAARCAVATITLETARCAARAFTARRALGPLAFEAARRAFAALALEATWRTLGAFTLELTRRALATLTLKATWSTLSALAFKLTWRAFATFTVKATRSAFSALTFKPTRRTFATFTLKAARSTFATLALKFTRRPLTTFTFKPSRRTGLTIAARRAVRRRTPGSPSTARIALARKRSLSTRRPRAALRAAAATRKTRGLRRTFAGPARRSFARTGGRCGGPRPNRARRFTRGCTTRA
ncbi:MAG: hypothetical protein RXR52_23575, partial [Paraburkholderia sp.]